jgi:hypothetical protein
MKPNIGCSVGEVAEPIGVDEAKDAEVNAVTATGATFQNEVRKLLPQKRLDSVNALRVGVSAVTDLMTVRWVVATQAVAML